MSKPFEFHTDVEPPSGPPSTYRDGPAQALDELRTTLKHALFRIERLERIIANHIPKTQREDLHDHDQDNETSCHVCSARRESKNL